MSNDGKESIPEDAKVEVSVAVPGDSAPTSLANGTSASPMLVEKRAVLSEDPEVDDNEAEEEDEEEGVQEEDALFTALEHSEEEKEAKEPHETPVDKALAPTLLKSALETGAINSDSEDDEKKNDEKAAKEAKAKADAPAGHHSRVSEYLSDNFGSHVICLDILEGYLLILTYAIFSPLVQSTRLFAFQSQRIFQLYFQGFGRFATRHGRKRTQEDGKVGKAQKKG